MYPRKLTYGSVFSAVEHVTNAGNDLFYFLQLEKKKKELVVKKSAQFSDINEIIKNEAKHLFLIINNLQVLTKEVNFINDDTEVLVQEAFPNITIQDFYFDTYSNDEGSFVVIARKEYINNLISEYRKKGINIIGIGLGSLVLKNLLNFLNSEVSITTSNSTITVKNSTIINISKENIEKQYFSINGLEISNHDTLALSGILSYYSGRFLGLEEINSQLTNTYEKKKIFSLNLSIMLGFLLVSLLINFFIFNNYYSKVNNLTAELSLNEAYKNQLISLQEEVKTKETVLESLQSVSQSKLASYLDDIGQLVPNTITLNEINYQPIISRFKKGKKIKADYQKIVIKGLAKKEADFALFINLLETKNWIDNVVINGFSKNKNSTNSFELLIQQHHD